MNHRPLRLPRQLEDEGISETVLEAFRDRSARLGQEGSLEVISLPLDDALGQELRRSALARRILFGYDEIAKKLSNEARGIEAVARRSDVTPGERLSRLLLIANDGSERFYRRLETLIANHSPRVLGCLLDCSADHLGQAATGRNRRVKVVMAEHKDTVSAILRLLV